MPSVLRLASSFILGALIADGAAVAQITVDWGRVYAQAGNDVPLLTMLPGTPERTVVNLTARDSLSHPCMCVDPVSFFGEGVYQRIGDTFFLCAKSSRGPGNNPYGVANGSAVVWVTNRSPVPMVIRGTVLIEIEGAGFAQFTARLGTIVSDFDTPGSFEFERTMQPSDRFELFSNTQALSILPMPAPNKGIAIALLSIEPQGCPGQVVVNQTAGMVYGGSGVAPILGFLGCATSGAGHFDLRVARPNAASALLVGSPGTGVPVLGGILWPSNFAAIPMSTGPDTMGFGAWSVPVAVAPGVHGSFMLQALVIDPGAIHGVAFSNALTLMF